MNPIVIRMFGKFVNATSPRPGVAVKTVRLEGTPTPEVTQQNPSPAYPNAQIIKDGLAGEILLEIRNAAPAVAAQLAEGEEVDVYVVPKGTKLVEAAPT